MAGRRHIVYENLSIAEICCNDFFGKTLRCLVEPLLRSPFVGQRRSASMAAQVLNPVLFLPTRQSSTHSGREVSVGLESDRVLHEGLSAICHHS